MSRHKLSNILGAGFALIAVGAFLGCGGKHESYPPTPNTPESVKAQGEVLAQNLLEVYEITRLTENKNFKGSPVKVEKIKPTNNIFKISISSSNGYIKKTTIADPNAVFEFYNFNYSESKKGVTQNTNFKSGELNITNERIQSQAGIHIILPRNLPVNEWAAVFSLSTKNNELSGTVKYYQVNSKTYGTPPPTPPAHELVIAKEAPLVLTNGKWSGNLTCNYLGTKVIIPVNSIGVSINEGEPNAQADTSVE